MFIVRTSHFFAFESSKFPWASCQICKIAGCACVENAENVFPRHRGLVISTCITARAWRTCRDAWRDRYIAISFEIDGGKNIPGIPGACATCYFTYLVRGPWTSKWHIHLSKSIGTAGDLHRYTFTYLCSIPDSLFLTDGHSQIIED